MNTGLVIGIALGIVMIALLVSLSLVIKRRVENMSEDLKQKIRRNKEKRIIGPESAHFSGAKRVHGKVKGLGVIALTNQHVYFNKMGGTLIAIPRKDIRLVENKKVFNGVFKGGQVHLVLTLVDENQIGFIVKNNDKWLKKLHSSIPS